MTSSGCSQDLNSVLYGKPEDMEAHETLRDPSPGSQRGTQKGGSKSRGTIRTAYPPQVVVNVIYKILGEHKTER